MMHVGGSNVLLRKFWSQLFTGAHKFPSDFAFLYNKTVSTNSVRQAVASILVLSRDCGG